MLKRLDKMKSQNTLKKLNYNNGSNKLLSYRHDKITEQCLDEQWQGQHNINL